MIRLAYIIPTLDAIGGAERQLLLLAKAFSSRGWHVTVIVLSGSAGDVAEELKTAGIACYSLRMRKAWIDPRGWIRYLAWHTVQKPDIVHSHLPHATFFARLVRLVAPVPVLIDTIHTIHTGTRVRRFLYRLTRHLSSHVTCVANSVLRSCTDVGLVSGDHLSVIPNAIEAPSFPKPQPTFDKSPHPFLWVALGRLAAVKDYPTLLRAFALLPGEPRLTVAGSGPDHSGLIQLAYDLNIDDRVRFIGFVANVWPLLAASDGFVLSSLWEGLPVSVLEACAVGLPVVTTETEGAREALACCSAGYHLVPVSDVTALAEAMASVMAMPASVRTDVQASNRKASLQHFSLPVIANRWADLYTQLLDSHAKPRRKG